MTMHIDCLTSESTHIIYHPAGAYAIVDPTGEKAAGLFKKFGWYNERMRKQAVFPATVYFEITNRTTGQQRHWSCVCQDRDHVIALKKKLEKQSVKPQHYVPEWLAKSKEYQKIQREIAAKQPIVNVVSCSLVSPVGSPEGEAELEEKLYEIGDPTIINPVEYVEVVDNEKYQEACDDYQKKLVEMMEFGDYQGIRSFKATHDYPQRSEFLTEEARLTDGLDHSFDQHVRHPEEKPAPSCPDVDIWA